MTAWVQKNGVLTPLSSLSAKTQKRVQKIIDHERRWNEELTRALKRAAQPLEREPGRPHRSVLSREEQTRVRELLAEIRTLDFTGMLGPTFADKAYGLAEQACELADELMLKYDASIIELEPIVDFIVRCGDAHEEWNYVDGLKMRPEEWIARGRPNVAAISGRGEQADPSVLATTYREHKT